MTTFIGIEKWMGGVIFAKLEDYGVFKIGKRDLKTRIRNLKRSGADTTEEEKALAALEDA